MDLIILLIIVALPIVSNLLINTSYKKYSKKESRVELTGKEVARKILDANGLSNVKITRISGNLTDNYNPQNKTVSLSDDIYDKSSISAISVAAHECGHAIQDKEKYFPLVFRSKLVPIVNFTSRFATIFLIIGIASELANLFTLGIIMLLIGLLFELITLPVEFNASNRAKKQLKKLDLISESESNGVGKVLSAAAFTYVANFLAMLLQILRLIYNRKD